VCVCRVTHIHIYRNIKYLLECRCHVPLRALLCRQQLSLRPANLIHIHIHIHREVARTVVAPPSSDVKCLWEVFVWGFGVLFLSCVCVCVCVSVLGVLYSVGVCVCV